MQNGSAGDRDGHIGSGWYSKKHRKAYKRFGKGVKNVRKPYRRRWTRVTFATAGDQKSNKEQEHVLKMYEHVCKKVALAIETATLAAAGNQNPNEEQEIC